MKDIPLPRPHDRYCPFYGKSHRYSDWTYQGYEHPRCDCGYEDVTRTLPMPKESPK